jgi:hypothetical protein
MRDILIESVLGLGVWCMLTLGIGLFFGALGGLWPTVLRWARNLFLVWAAWVVCVLIGTLVP